MLDFTRQPAADLATQNGIAIYPIGGWWKDRVHLGRWDRPARYALIVSIESPRTDVDIDSPVEAEIRMPIPITT